LGVQGWRLFIEAIDARPDVSARESAGVAIQPPTFPCLESPATVLRCRKRLTLWQNFKVSAYCGKSFA